MPSFFVAQIQTLFIITTYYSSDSCEKLASRTDYEDASRISKIKGGEGLLVDENSEV